MFRKILIAASIVAAAFSFQAPAQAGGGFSIGFSTGHGFNKGGFVGFKKFHHGGGKKFHGGKTFGHGGFKKHHRVKKFHHGGFKKHHGGFQVKKKFVKPHHKGFHGRKHFAKPHYVSKKKVVKKNYHLSNKQLRHRLRNNGLYNIRFIDRHNGVAKLVAHNKRGYVGKYEVSTSNGRILDGQVLRHF